MRSLMSFHNFTFSPTDSTLGFFTNMLTIDDAMYSETVLIDVM